MLGLYTKNGWRAGFAIAVTGALVGVGSSAAIAAPVTRAEAQGVNATGAIVEILDTGDCITDRPAGLSGHRAALWRGPGDRHGQCVLPGRSRLGAGPGSLQGTPWAQSASILQGTAYSRGYASVAPIDIDGLGEVSLTDIFDGFAAADTGTFLDPILHASWRPIAVALHRVLTPLSDGLQAGLDGG